MISRTLLSLDGGGVRGLAELIILQHLMMRIDPDNPPKPCEVFDLIGGTSTGGLIAVMLGRLEMDVESAIEAYMEMSKSIFTPKRSGIGRFKLPKDLMNLNGRFNTAGLEASIKRIIAEYLGDIDAPMLSDNPSACKVFVCAVRKETLGAVCLKSYHSIKGFELPCKIWEACRATSAATSFFDPIKIGSFGEEFVDGALGTNNPVNEVLAEARALWPDDEINGIVSIGTGVKVQPGLGSSMLQASKAIVKMATETEKTAQNFVRYHPEYSAAEKYIRLNVSNGLDTVGLQDYDKANVMAAATRTYLQEESVRLAITAFVTKLRESKPQFSLHKPVSESIQSASESEATLVESEAGQELSTEITSFGSFQDWLASFSKFEEVEDVQKDGGKPVLRFLTNSPDSEDVEQSAEIQDCDQAITQSVPYKYKSLCRKVAASDQVHLIVVGLQSKHRSTVRDFVIDRSASIFELIQHLGSVDEGSAEICGFKVKHHNRTYAVGSTASIHVPQLVKVTAGKSSCSTKEGLAINLDDTHLHFYNRVLSSADIGLNFTILPDAIRIKQMEGHDALIDFRRTPRVPDDGNVFSLPPPDGTFTLLPVRSFQQMPEPMKKKGGVFFPMLQREAVSIRFFVEPRSYYSGDVTDTEYAVRIYAGSVNVLTGSMAGGQTKEQDHVVLPTQKYVSGFRIDDGLSRQFTAMPIGEHYTAEFHLTGQEYINGIQLEIATALRETAVFAVIGSSHDSPKSEDFQLDIRATPRTAGLLPGQTVSMQDTASNKTAGLNIIGNHELQQLFKTDRQLQGIFKERKTGAHRSFESARQYLRRTHVHELFAEPLDSYYLEEKIKPPSYSYANEKADSASKVDEYGVEYYVPPGSQSPPRRPTPPPPRPPPPPPRQKLLQFEEKSSLVITPIRMEPCTIDFTIEIGRLESTTNIHRCAHLEISPFLTLSALFGLMECLVHDYVLEEGGIPDREFKDLHVYSKGGLKIYGDKYPSGYYSFDRNQDRRLLEYLNNSTRPIRFEVEYYYGIDFTEHYEWPPYKQPPDEFTKGWDMGLAAGGLIRETIHEDLSPQKWDWEGARSINIQILNSVAFQSITGVRPPISTLPLNLPEIEGNALSWITHKTGRLTLATANIPSVTDIDLERGYQFGVTVNEDEIIACACCEASIVDTICVPCKHAFCRSCILYFMTKNGVSKCGYCGEIIKECTSIAAPSALAQPRMEPQHARISNSADQGDRHLTPTTTVITSPEMETILNKLEKPTIFEKSTNELRGNPQFILGAFATELPEDYELLLPWAISQLLQMRGSLSEECRNEIHEVLSQQLVNIIAYDKPPQVLQMLLPVFEALGHPACLNPGPDGLSLRDLVTKLMKLRRRLQGFSGIVDVAGPENTVHLCTVARILLIRNTNDREFVDNATRASLDVLKSIGVDLASIKIPGYFKNQSALAFVKNVDAVQFLLEEGLGVDVKDDVGKTPLHHAANCNAHELGKLELLLNFVGKGSPVLNMLDDSGRAPAYYCRGWATVEMFLKVGADPELAPKREDFS